MAKFDEIGTFQFLTNFTKNALVSHIIKLKKCATPLRKAGKICNFREIKNIKAGKILLTIYSFRFIKFILERAYYCARTNSD